LEVTLVIRLWKPAPELQLPVGVATPAAAVVAAAESDVIDLRAEAIVGVLHVLKFAALVLESDVLPDSVEQISNGFVERSVSVRSEGRKRRCQVPRL
jgi:hypothetical protein